MSGRYMKLAVDGQTTVGAWPDPGSRQVLGLLYDQIGCQTVEALNIPGNGKHGDLTVWIDEEGKLVADPQPNPLATRLMGPLLFPGDRIHGVAVVSGGVDPDGESLGLSDQDVAWLVEQEEAFIRETPGKPLNLAGTVSIAMVATLLGSALHDLLDASALGPDEVKAELKPMIASLAAIQGGAHEAIKEALARRKQTE